MKREVNKIGKGSRFYIYVVVHGSDDTAVFTPDSNLYKAVIANPTLASFVGTSSQVEERINELANLLISLQSKGYSGSCWGYNFDWQARRLFLFPKYTPTVVATNFCATALIDAYEVTKNQKYLDVALSAAEFVMTDHHRAECNDG